MTTENDDVELPANGNYASDRHLLLQEIKTLAKEVSRLRGDTKYLQDVTVPREEQRRHRRVWVLLALIGFLCVTVPGLLFYLQQQEINDDRVLFMNRSIAVCEQRNEANRNLASLVDTLLTARPAENAPPPNPEVVEALRAFKESLRQVDCSTLTALP